MADAVQAEYFQQQRADGDAEAGGELLVDRKQAVAAAVLVGAQVGDGKRVHRGKLQRVAQPGDKKQRHPHPDGRVLRRQGNRRHQQAEQAGVGEDGAAVAVAGDDRFDERLGDDGADHGRRHQPAGEAGAVAERDLIQQRHEEGHGADAEAADEVAGEADAESTHQNEAYRKERVVAAPRVAQVGEGAGKRQYREQERPRQIGAAVRGDFQREGQPGGGDGNQHEAAGIKAGVAIDVRHDGNGAKDADDAEGDIDEEYPVPARVLDEVTADQRAEDGADERGHDGVIDGVDEPVFFIDFQQRQARHRHDDGAAHALNDARTDEHRQAGGERAEERAEHEDDERDDEGFARAEAVGEVAAGGDEQGDGEGVGDDGGLHIERRDVQVGGDGGQGGVEDGRIQHLHEDGDGHQQRKPARGRGGGVHVWVWQKRTVIIVFSVFLAMAMRA